MPVLYDVNTVEIFHSAKIRNAMGVGVEAFRSFEKCAGGVHINYLALAFNMH